MVPMRLWRKALVERVWLTGTISQLVSVGCRPSDCAFVSRAVGEPEAIPAAEAAAAVEDATATAA